jgi:hypothetical protein
MEDIFKDAEVVYMTSEEIRNLKTNLDGVLENIKTLITPEWLENHPRQIVNGREYYDFNKEDYDLLGIKLRTIILSY